MPYRPKDWENDWDSEREFDGMSSMAEVFEAGADAMLAYLKSQEHQDWLATEEGQNSKGEWYYIPDMV